MDRPGRLLASAKKYGVNERQSARWRQYYSIGQQAAGQTHLQFQGLRNPRPIVQQTGSTSGGDHVLHHPAFAQGVQ